MLCVRAGTLEMLHFLYEQKYIDVNDVNRHVSPLVPDITPPFWPWKVMMGRRSGEGEVLATNKTWEPRRKKCISHRAKIDVETPTVYVFLKFELWVFFG